MAAEYDNKNRWNMTQQPPINELVFFAALLFAAETAGITMVQHPHCFVCSLFVIATSHGTAITVWPFLVAVQTQLSWTSGSIWRSKDGSSEQGNVLAEGQMLWVCSKIWSWYGYNLCYSCYLVYCLDFFHASANSSKFYSKLWNVEFYCLVTISKL